MLKGHGVNNRIHILSYDDLTHFSCLSLAEDICSALVDIIDWGVCVHDKNNVLVCAYL